ncbi:NAD-dependent epimerase/dehydratase family protein [Paenibacillus sp. MMS18-CY102]|uniref:NAD-dependent epimerase/dehydratase family protein n=1 Tax=Paenibacillus sp. MMS18-CY102 TaxID=2682849 RepID=UPI001365859B|nr:NAD(P)-dependent oxidoreductase [Paenibacillus sp. MMS18-CY102]MWC27125.1 NAD-dependent epimerase/dehydratase family protein [Paenibacillus sp. MMS18-CY102]
MRSKTIAVTGGSGKLGKQLIPALQKLGFEVVSLDMARSDQPHVRQIKVDLNDFGQVVGALHGADAIVHLGAIPAPLGHPNATIFANNALSTYHLLEAASILGIGQVVLGSSESSYGFAWAPAPFAPSYVPVDEDHPQQPQECYGLSKIVNEQTAAMFARRSGSNMRIYSLRYSMIVGANEYAGLATDRPEHYTRNLWSYIDIRDAVSATIAALGAEAPGAHCLNITADDTLSDWETARLLAHFYPEVTDVRERFSGRQAVVSNQRAKQVLGWAPDYSWTNQHNS